MKTVAKQTGKHAIAAALRRLAEESSLTRSGVAVAARRLEQIEAVAAVIANEIAAASAVHITELTALRRAVERMAGADDEPQPRVIGRK